VGRFEPSENRCMDREGLGVLVNEEIATNGMRSTAPSVYVPRRLRIGGIEGIRTGAAIVGTPQGDGMVAINVESTAYVQPSMAVWITWMSEAVRRHASDHEEQLLMDEESRTRLVPEAALLEVGKWEGGRLALAESGDRDEITHWIQAGAAAYELDGYLPSAESEAAA
jgi:hypothetical protein